ncbi:MAG: hypothetical protein ACOH1I_07615 [Gallionellaceae bacterium]
MRSLILLSLSLLSAVSFAEAEYVVEGSKIERPEEAKQFAVCSPFEVTDSEANLFFKLAVPVAYQSEELIIGPCSVYGTLKREALTARWEIYMGGAGVIYEAQKDPQWFYCGKKCCAKLGRKVCG